MSSFIVDAGTISPPAFCSKRVSPRVSETTITPHVPPRMRPVSPAIADESSPVLRGDVYLTTGTGGGLLRLGLRAGRRFEVCFFFVCCTSTMVGVTKESVSARRTAFRMLRENIYAFVDFGSGWEAVRLEYTPRWGIFSKGRRTGLDRGDSWLSGSTTFFVKEC